ncbi:MAG: GGDEF domain-containing protein [Campylobacterales bacterium]|nr:GGDEF domain-containing protein [Campylobacterales bacterium]
MKNTKTFWMLAANVMGMMILFGAVLVLLFRHIGYQGADSRANMAAAIVQESLTSHMRAGSSDAQNDLLQQIGTIEGIRSAWVVRSDPLVRQYGKGVYPQEPRDEIDRAVLREGKSLESVEGGLFSDTIYRLTIPYVATGTGKIDCMSCHEAKTGDVLGAVSIEMEVNDLKAAGILSALGALAVLFMVMVILLRVVRRFTASYKESLESVAAAMEKAEGGDYTHRIDPSECKEGYSAIMWTNAVLEKLQGSLSESGTKLNALLRIDQPKSDPLYTLQTGINQLYDIERFRTSIEKDHNLGEVYERIVALIRTRWGFDDFTIFELNPMTKSTRLVHAEKTLLCDAPNSGCRADRSSGIIDSTQCEVACPKMIDPTVHYLCRNYPIADDLDVVISIVTHRENEIPSIRLAAEEMGNFINASKLQIINKKLEESVRIDPLTALYNRRYLEELSALIVAQSKRTVIPYALLMVDMDRFASINHSYDEQVGNEVIKAMARNIQELIRPGDIVIRYGGDTFAVVLYDYESEEARQLAEALLASFKKKIRVNTYAILKTISVGMAFFPVQTEDMAYAVELAKRALLEAKHRGGNCAVEYEAASMPM